MEPIQFGEPKGDYLTLKGAYGVVLNEKDEVLVVEVNDAYHLGGGRLEEGEEAEVALRREMIEEAGCKIGELKLIGEANGWYEKSKLGPLNKQGTFYKCELLEQSDDLKTEPDHHPKWVSRREVADSNMSDFQKWAVEKAFE